MGPREIVVGLDFSEDAEAALELAVTLARALGAELHLVHVWQRPLEILSPYEVPLPESIAREAREAARRRLDEERARIAAMGLSVQAHLREGTPAESLAEAARALGGELIVLGTRGRTGLAHVLLGSVAERTLRLAPCPVLTTRARAR